MQTRQLKRAVGMACWTCMVAALCLAISGGQVWGQERKRFEPPEIFVKNCAPCHSKDGRAQTPAAKKLGVKDLTVSKVPDEQIVRAILEGKQDEKKISKMPAFKDKFKTEEIELLVKTVKAFRR